MYKPFNLIQTSPSVRSVYIYSFRLLYDLKAKISFNLKVIFKEIFFVSVPDSAKVPVNLNGGSGEREYF